MTTIRMTFVSDELGQWYLIPATKRDRFYSHTNPEWREAEFGADRVQCPDEYSFTDPNTSF